jgi:hypothetical protein
VEELLLGGAPDVESFLERWYGITNGLGVDEAAMDTAAPFALARWHALAANIETPITFHDFPIALQDLQCGDLTNFASGSRVRNG